MSMTKTGSGHAWAPRRPKSRARIWTRYVIQWIWGPPLWLLVRLPLILLILLEVDVDVGGGGSSHNVGRRRRMWIDRERLHLDRITDPLVQEKELRRLLAAHQAPCLSRPVSRRPVPAHSGSTYRFAMAEDLPPMVRGADGGLERTCTGGFYRLTVDDSHYRVIGAARALEIAHTEFGWVPADGVEEKLPRRLALRCP